MDSPLIPSEQTALDFVKWTLSDVARRPTSKTKHQKLALRSEHMSRQSQAGYFRGSDLSERLYVCVRALERVGYRNKDACVKVAELSGDLLGRSKRGRRRKNGGEPDLLSKADAIRTRVSKLSRRLEFTAALVDFQLGDFLFLRRHGVVEGSKYVPNSGQKMVEAWQAEIRKLRRLDLFPTDRSIRSISDSAPLR